MYKVNEDLSIYATRGDFVSLTVTAENNGAPYTFMPERLDANGKTIPADIVGIRITAKKNANKELLDKSVEVLGETEAVDLFLEDKDTQFDSVISKPTDYWYEIYLKTYLGTQTIIGYDEDGAKIFRLYPEGADLEEV